MKIDILHPPPADIFKDRGKYTLMFILFMLLAFCGLFLGVYAIVSDTMFYEKLETAALTSFVVAALLLTYYGEKLQAYKKLTPPQQKELADLCQKHSVIKTYCDLVAKADRQPIRVEYEICQEWAEAASKQAD